MTDRKAPPSPNQLQRRLPTSVAKRTSTKESPVATTHARPAPRVEADKLTLAREKTRHKELDVQNSQMKLAGSVIDGVITIADRLLELAVIEANSVAEVTKYEAKKSLVLEEARADIARMRERAASALNRADIATRLLQEYTRHIDPHTPHDTRERILKEGGALIREVLRDA